MGGAYDMTYLHYEVILAVGVLKKPSHFLVLRGLFIRADQSLEK